jgi:RNA polymerase sigma factor (sigma-70 family)
MASVTNSDTDMGGSQPVFPGTRCSVIDSARSADPRERRDAFETLVAAYWKPVYKYLRCKWPLSNEDAKDLTQGFFTRALEKGFFDNYDPAKAKFRTFLRVCVDRFVSNELKSASRLKRGGDQVILSLDFDQAEDELRRIEVADRTDSDELFDRECLRNLFELAVEELRRQCETSGKIVHFKLFERYDLREPEMNAGLTYAQLGEEVGLSSVQVTNYLAFARAQFRKLVIERIRATTGSDEEFQSEVRRILGGLPR